MNISERFQNFKPLLLLHYSGKNGTELAFCNGVQWIIFNQKKLDRGGKDHPPGIILRRDRNVVPAEKIPEP
jgi:hypothetical protein